MQQDLEQNTVSGSSEGFDTTPAYGQQETLVSGAGPVNEQTKLPSIGTHLKEAYAMVVDRAGVLSVAYIALFIVNILTLYIAAKVVFLLAFNSGGFEMILPLMALVGIGCVAYGVWTVIIVMIVDSLLTPHENSTVGRHIYRAVALFVPALWIVILVGLATTGGFVLLVIPGILLSLWFSLVIPVMIADRYRGWDALCASRELVRNYTGEVFIRYLVVGILLAVIGGIAGLILDLVVSAVLPSYGLMELIVSQIIPILINTVLWIYIVAFGVRLYQYLKERKGVVDPSNPKRGWYMAAAVLGLLVILGYTAMIGSVLL